MCFLTGPLPTFSQQSDGNEAAEFTLSPDDPAVRHVMEIQDVITDVVLGIDGVVGLGTGMTLEKVPALVIFTETEEAAKALPHELAGIPVVTYVCGTPEPLAASAPTTDYAKSFALRKETVDRTSRLERPVPIGVSTGNWNDCSGGTIGVRVRNGNNYYILSCNHVFARTNYAALNEKVVQPGRGDVSCNLYPADTIGFLADYETIIHSTSANNLMDAAMVRVDPWIVSNRTPTDGYGIPSATIAVASVSMSLKKYGKTTGLTTTSVVAINATINMNYGVVTRFINQIVTFSSSTFVDVGDSGSLVVTNTSQNRPVGLVFGKSGGYTFINPIGPILSRFNVQVDDDVNNPLPVELTSFSARLQEKDVQLKWQTATELQNFGFYVQRSGDKKNWEELDFVAGGGTVFSPRSYSYSDRRAVDLFGANTIYYRLMQVDADGTTDYSAIVEVTSRPVATEMQVYPQPVRGEATVQLQLQDASDGVLHVYDASGQRLDQFTRSVAASSGMQLLPLSFSSAAPGNYFLEYRNQGEVIRKHIMVIR
ncbi:MAG: T9SS type A sorting domain-containing protein [Bacteroidetes bacterium]|nr:T9SS type A sorting domain-containing protein [Bacteroidota bacterium]